ncbi:ATP-binding protein [Allosphingosinicella flava]|uniref:ATP-binding protein n=1 Tax=Allosphingosinicella flava TaxID=2771430 RepID=A0A7T2LLP2_9SPHN|nr:ATP-binding protein [Sphingosinicella flava]QPQ54232.1 ATP-binding protein [Sphingosinicella flava]
MSLRLLGQEAFVEAKRAVFFPSKAITSPEHLFGRSKQLDQISRAFASDGKQVFIYGERGVGKTSLAKTAAIIHQSSDNDPAIVSCEATSTFRQIMEDVAIACLPTENLINKVTSTRGINIGVKGMNIELAQQIESGSIPPITNINRAIAILKYIALKHSNKPIVIIDEFDRIEDPAQKKSFAEFIKQISDQDLPIKFIFCGISRDIESLIGQHFSAGRYMAPVELGPLPHDALWQIFDQAEITFGITIDRELKIRAGRIADGYPYFMHLIGDCLLWNMYAEQPQADVATPEIFEKSVQQAVEDAEPMLRDCYDTATKKYANEDYHEILWAVSAVTVFPKKWDEIYDKYYRNIIHANTPESMLTKDQFYKRILKLTKESHGEILRTNENGWYEFRENVVRSYVRLRAVEAGVDLDVDLPGPLAGASQIGSLAKA